MKKIVLALALLTAAVTAGVCSAEKPAQAGFCPMPGC